MKYFNRGYFVLFLFASIFFLNIHPVKAATWIWHSGSSGHIWSMTIGATLDKSVYNANETINSYGETYNSSCNNNATYDGNTGLLGKNDLDGVEKTLYDFRAEGFSWVVKSKYFCSTTMFPSASVDYCITPIPGSCDDTLSGFAYTDSCVYSNPLTYNDPTCTCILNPDYKAKANQNGTATYSAGPNAATSSVTFTAKNTFFDGLRINLGSIPYTVIVPLPDKPTTVTATAGACDTGEITLNWASVAGATGYDTQIDGVWSTDRGNNTKYTYTGLGNSTSHTFAVRAWNSAGEGTGKESTPSKITTAEKCSNPTATLTWNGSSNISSADPMASRTWVWGSSNADTYTGSVVISGCDDATANGTTSPWVLVQTSGGSNTAIPGVSRYGCSVVATYTASDSVTGKFASAVVSTYTASDSVTGKSATASSRVTGKSASAVVNVQFMSTPSINTKENGECGLSKNSCTPGTPSPLSDTAGYYNWKCLGTETPKGDATCSLAIPSTKPECSDGKDNDKDGKTDKYDPGCNKDGLPDSMYDRTDIDETDALPPVITAVGFAKHKRIMVPYPTNVDLKLDLKRITGCTLTKAPLSHPTALSTLLPNITEDPKTYPVTVTANSIYKLTCGLQSDSLIIEILSGEFES